MEISRPLALIALTALLLTQVETNLQVKENYVEDSLPFSEPQWESKFPRINDRPVIGILTHEATSSHKQYFSADYAKFLRSAGARVVPLSYKWTDERLKSELSKLNGAVATGGGDVLTEGDNMLTPYSQKVKVLLEFSREELQNNRYFPIWGVCMGLEAMHIIFTNQTRALGNSKAHHISLPLIFKENYKHTRMYQHFPNRLIQALKQRPLAYNSHDEGVPLSYYKDKELGLTKIFNVLTTSLDPSGVEIVTSVSHKELPVFAVMYHPEKAPYDFGEGYNLNHDPYAIELALQHSNFFVFEARRSELRYPFDELNRNVIQNYQPQFLDSYESYGYIFDGL